MATARRTRSLLIDATLGKIFMNTNQVTPSDPSKLIAGTKLQTTIISAPKTVSPKVANNLGLTGTGKKFPNGGLLTQADLKVVAPPLGSSIIVVLRKGDTYETSEVIATLEILSGLTASNSQNLAVTLAPNQAIFMDVSQVGVLRPGKGLSITLRHYSG